MTIEDDNHEPTEFPELPDDITALLSDAATWAPVDPAAEDDIVAAILAESAASAPVASLADRRDARTAQAEQAPPAGGAGRWRSMALGAAAALLVVAGLFGVSQLAGDDADFEVAMAGTDLAPDASAIAEITDTPEGTRIVISVEDLPPAAPGTYYQAWLRKDAEIGVSAGTFHLRSGSDSAIELWAGVSTDDYPLLTVTIQEEAQTESSGRVVLKVLIE